MGRRLVIAAIAVPIGLALLLGAEILLAINGPSLPAQDPFELSGLIGDPSGGEPLRMAWMGDSVTAGTGASGPDAALPRVVAAALDRPVQVDVIAVAGERIAGALSDQLPLLQELPRPDVVVVEIGANDVTHLTGLDEIRRDYERLLEGVTELGASHVVALGIPAFHTTPRFLQPLRAIVGFRARRVDREIREAAAAAGATYVDIAGSTAGEFGEDPDLYYADDEFHPSDAGYARWAEAVLEALEDLGVA